MDNQKKDEELDKTYKKGVYQDDRRRKSFQGQDKFYPRQNRFSPRNQNENFRSRSERGFQGRDDRTGFRARTNEFKSRDAKFQSRDSKFQPRDSKFQPRGTFQPRRPSFRQNVSYHKKLSVRRPPVYSEMQITDGKHRGKFIKSISAAKVRPTARRMREIMFKIIFRRIRAGRVLDLCAGSGMVGIEAISRGAIVCTFVERSSRMCSFIKKNLDECGIKEGHGEVTEMEAMPFLKKIAKRKRKWDVIFYDPPYDANYDEVLDLLSRGVAIEKNGCLVIEHHSEMFFPEKLGILGRFKVVLNGENAMSFYERLK